MSTIPQFLIVKVIKRTGDSYYALCQTIVEVDDDPEIREAIDTEIERQQGDGVFGGVCELLEESQAEFMALASKVQVKPPRGIDV